MTRRDQTSRSRLTQRSRHFARPSVLRLESRQLLSGTTVDEFLLPSPTSSPRCIVEGSDGNLWFTEYGGNIGRITPGGQVTEFPIPTLAGEAPAHPTQIIAGPDGDLWFLDEGDSKVGRVTPQGQITEFSLPSNSGSVDSIAFGSDGNLWFNSNPNGFVDNVGAAAIGRMTPDGQSTLFPLPKTGTASTLTLGPDGNIWFLDPPDGKVGSISPSGQITETAEPTPDYLSGLTTATDGALWSVADGAAGPESLVRLVPGNQAQSFPLSNGTPTVMVAGPDGSIVFLVGPAYDDLTSPVIDQISRDGVITNIPLSVSGSGNADDLTYGPDGNLWLTGTNSAIDRVDLVPTPSPPPMLVGQGLAPVSPVGEEIELTLADIRFSPGITVAATTIDWGDGSTSPGTFPTSSNPLGANPPQTGEVSGEHVYSAAGTYHGSVIATGVDSDGKSSSVTVPVTIDAVDPTPVAQPLPTIDKSAGVAFQRQVVAQFQTPTPHDPSGSDFTATIDWGDGTAPTVGTVVNGAGYPFFTNPVGPVGTTSSAVLAASPDLFDVLGDHTYATAGDYTIRVTITDQGGDSATSATSAQILPSPLLLTPLPVSTTLDPVEDQLTLADLLDFRGVDQSRTYTATIDWGDGSTPTSGSLTTILQAEPADLGSSTGSTTGLNSQFALVGNHDYTKVGTYTISYTVTDSDGNTTRGTTTAQVTPENLEVVPPGVSLTGPLGLQVAAGEAASAIPLGVILTTDKGETASSFTATISWGDGTPDSAGTISAESPNSEFGLIPSFDRFDVFGDHTFAAPGRSEATLTIASGDGSTTEYSFLITAVRPGVVNATGVNAYPAIIAQFSSDEPNASPGDFEAVIDSGDGSPLEAGTIQVDTFSPQIGQTNFSIMDNHVYTQSGIYNVSITLTGADGVSVTVTTHVAISIAANPGDGSGSPPANPTPPAASTTPAPDPTPVVPPAPTAPGVDPTQTSAQGPHSVYSPGSNVPVVGPLPEPLPLFLSNLQGGFLPKSKSATHKAHPEAVPTHHAARKAMTTSPLAASRKLTSPATHPKIQARVTVHHASPVLTHAKSHPVGPKTLKAAHR